VNAELQTKIEELSESVSDTKNLLNNTDVATIFLDNQLLIRRFTPQATRIINLIPTDVGRSITDIVSSLDYQTLVPDIHEVLATLQIKESRVQTTDGHWFLMRILPYRTVENNVNGVVLTFLDITHLKVLETSLQATQTYAEQVLTLVGQPIAVMSPDLTIRAASREFCKALSITRDGIEGKNLSSLPGGRENAAALQAALGQALKNPRSNRGQPVELKVQGARQHRFLLNVRQLRVGNQSELILLALREPDRA
jgi:two-component system CheB/CheR fusion protein